MYLSDFDEYEAPIVKIPISPCHKKRMHFVPEHLWACPACGLVYHEDFVKEYHRGRK